MRSSGVGQLVARQAHNLEVTGSNPVPDTNLTPRTRDEMEIKPWTLVDDGAESILVVGQRQISFPASNRNRLLEVVAAHNDPNPQCPRDKCIISRTTLLCIYCGYPKAGSQ